MTVREFDGVDDDLQVDVGALSGFTYGTVAFTVKFVSFNLYDQIFALHTSAGVGRMGIGRGTNGEWMWYDGGTQRLTPADTNEPQTGVWYTVVVRKATGSNAPRWSIYNHSTDSWVHMAATSAGADSTSPGAGGTVRFSFESADYPNIRIAARAAWNNSLPWSADTTGDAAIENAGLHLSTANWRKANPSALWLFNQAATTTDVKDLFGTADQTSLVGTAVSSDDPLGFSFESPRAPILAGQYEVAWDTSTTPKTASVTVDVGDVLVVLAAAENASLTLSTPTMTGVTWTQEEVYDNGSSGFPAAWVWSGVATQAGTFTLSVSQTGSTGSWGFNCLRYKRATGVGASALLYGNPGGTGHNGTPAVAITTTGPYSALANVISDWNAVDGASRAWLAVNGGPGIEHSYFRDSAIYAAYVARWGDAGAAGSKTVGVSAPSGQDAIILAVEILADRSFSQLQDNFEDESLDSVLWSLSSGGGLTRETGGRGGVLCDTGFNKIQTAFDWSMPVGSSIFVRAYPTDLAGATTECFNAMRFESDAQAGGTDLGIRVDVFNGNIIFESRTGHFDGSAVSIAYSATDHAWWRIYRSDSTTILMQTAPDSSGSPGTWTTRRTLTAPAWVDGVSDISLFFEVHRNSGTSNWFEIDNVNFQGSAAPPPANQGSANVSLGLALAATGEAAAEGSANVSLGMAAAATGETLFEGSANVSIGLAVAGTGEAPGMNTGSANISLGLSVASTGSRPSEGSANIPLGLATAATGSRPSQGTSNLNLGMVIVALGSTIADSQGVSNFNIDFALNVRGVALTRLIPIRVFSPEEILTGNRFTKYHLELLDQDESPLGTLDGVDDGELDWIASAMVKGAGWVVVRDVKQSVDWLNVRLRPVLKIKGLPDQPLGVFLVSESPDRWGLGHTWSLKLLDKTSILDQDTIAETLSIPAGAVVTDEVISLIVSAGITNYAVTSSAATLAGPLVWYPGTSKLRVVNDLLSVINYFSLYSNLEGQLIAEPYVLPAARPITYEFVDGNASIYDPEFARDVDNWKIPNRVIAISIGDGLAPALVSAPAENTDPSSPYSIANRGRVIGHVEAGVEAADQATLDAYARRRLVELTSPTSSVDISHAPVPGLTVNNTVRFRSVPAGIDRRHTVTRTKIRLRGTELAQSTFREVVDL